MSDEKDIFTRISSFDERMKLFEDLARAKGELLCKGKEDHMIKLRAMELNYAEGYLECTNQGSMTLTDAEELLCHFFLGSEKYYFQATISLVKGQVQLILSENVFHLQRRQNYRVHIPEKYAAHFNILKINGNEEKLIGKLADLSSGGCRVIYTMNAPLMKIGDEVIGQLTIKNQSPIELVGTVRHIKADIGNKIIQNFGIEFKDIAPTMENRLFAITMDLYKELFKRA